MAASDFYQICGSCGRKFLSYAKGKPVCLTCWAAENPGVLFSLGGDVELLGPGGEVVPEPKEIFPADMPADLFPGVDARLREKEGDG